MGVPPPPRVPNRDVNLQSIIWRLWLFTIYKKNPEILVGNFWSVRTVRFVYHLPKISALRCQATLDSSYNMKLVQKSRNL